MLVLITLIKQGEDFCSIGATKSSDIDAAERSLGVLFASDYREYAKAFGAATFDGHELTGICSSERLNVVSATERARQIYPNFPSDSYVVEELGYDNAVIIQDKSGCVFCYGPKDKAKKEAKSLLDYLFK